MDHHTQHARPSTHEIRIHKYRSPQDFILYLCTQLRFTLRKKHIQRREPDFIKHVTELYDMQMGLCAVSLLPMAIGGDSFGIERNPYQISIDRIDNEKGYLIGNVRLVCLWCNSALRGWGENVFYEFISSIYNNPKLRARMPAIYPASSTSRGQEL